LSCFVSNVADISLLFIERFHDTAITSQCNSVYKKVISSLTLLWNSFLQHACAAFGCDASPSGAVKMVTRAYAPESDAKIWSRGTTAATPEAPARMFRDYLQRQDRILADKGTLLQAYLDALRLEVRSTLPPFAHDGQLTDKEADRGYLISRRR